MWLEVGKTEDSMMDVSGIIMRLEVGATEESMVDAMYKEQGCG